MKAVLRSIGKIGLLLILVGVLALSASALPGVVTAQGDRPTLPPSWTPRATSTSSTRQTTTPMASPQAGLPGKLLAVYGNALTLDKNLPVVEVELDSGKMTQLFGLNDRGEFATFLPDGQQLLYSRFRSGTDDRQLRIVNLNGTKPVEVSTLWNNQPPLKDQRQVSLARNGRVLAFVANSTLENDKTSDVYYLPVRFLLPGEQTETPTRTATPTFTPNPSITPTATRTRTPFALTTGPATASPTPGLFASRVIRAIARDSGENSWPALSPDGKLVVFVSDTKPLGQEGIDLYVAGPDDAKPKNLTNDGLENVESAPAWSPDGKRIVYQNAKNGQATSDIYIMDANGANRKPLIEGTGDNIRPHWSPDGKWVAFSSNRSGKFEIFVANAETRQIFQVTRTPDPIICTDWGG